MTAKRVRVSILMNKDRTRPINYTRTIRRMYDYENMDYNYIMWREVTEGEKMLFYSVSKLRKLAHKLGMYIAIRSTEEKMVVAMYSLDSSKSLPCLFYFNKNRFDHEQNEI